MLTLVRAVVAAITGASCCYCALSIAAAAAWGRRRIKPVANEFPPVSILKPFKGSDPEMYESLRSHCTQQYPKYEILCGVNTYDDPAAGLVSALKSEFPASDIRLVLCEKVIGANRKVSTLAQLAREAKNDVLVINDSDVRVSGDYLSAIAAELQQPGVGLVTSLYRAVPGPSVWSQVESLSVTTDFITGVLLARQFEGGIRFALGSTMALKKSDLNRIGGFEAIADYLADDYQLGKRVADSGAKVELSRITVETFLPAYKFSDFLWHQLRWARTIRDSRPGGYAGLAVTFTVFWASLCLALARGAQWSIALFVLACTLRATSAAVAAAILNDRSFLRSSWLLPLRDLLAPFIWIAGLLGRRIVWRGEEFQLKDGKLSLL